MSARPNMIKALADALRGAGDIRGYFDAAERIVADAKAGQTATKGMVPATASDALFLLGLGMRARKLAAIITAALDQQCEEDVEVVQEPAPAPAEEQWSDTVRLMTVAGVIAGYRQVRADAMRPVESTSNTHCMLEHLVADLGRERVCGLTAERLAQWARQRAEQGAGGYTVNLELSLLRTAIRQTAVVLQVTLPDVAGLARPLLRDARLIAGCTRRIPRPAEGRLSRVLATRPASGSAAP